MTAAVVALIGVFLGALMAQAGSVLADRRQARTEAIRWRRDRKAAAYDGALRHLLRAANRRSKLTAEAGAVISQEDVGQTFDDIVEAQFWVHALAARCGAAQAGRIMDAGAILDAFVDSLVGGTLPKRVVSTNVWSEKPELRGVLPELITTITECAREDGGATTEVSRRMA
jgi:hypothetical protein